MESSGESLGGLVSLFEGNNIWKLWKAGLKRPIFVCGGTGIAVDAQSAYELAEQVGEASGGVEAYCITKLTAEEYLETRNHV